MRDSAVIVLVLLLAVVLIEPASADKGFKVTEFSTYEEIPAPIEFEEPAVEEPVKQVAPEPPKTVSAKSSNVASTCVCDLVTGCVCNLPVQTVQKATTTRPTTYRTSSGYYCDPSTGVCSPVQTSSRRFGRRR